MRNIMGICFLEVLLLTGCVFLDDSFHKNELSSVVLTQQQNPALTHEYRSVRSLDGFTHTLYLPNQVPLASLVAQLNYQGMTADVEGVSIPPGGTLADLTRPRTVAITGRDDVVMDYKIEAQYEPLVFKEFWFSNSENVTVNTWDTRVTIDSAGATRWLWDGVMGWSIPTSPTKKIKVTLPNWAPSTLVPRFIHNGVRVEYRGAELISGVTPIDTTTEQRVTLVGVDGTRQPVKLAFAYAPLTITSVQILAADNPSLHRDSEAVINEFTKRIDLEVPTSVDPTSLILEFTHTGKRLKSGKTPIVSGVTPVDLSSDRVLVVQGASGLEQEYTLHRTPVVPSSSKDLSSLVAYSSSTELVPYLPNYWDQGEFTITAGARNQVTLTGYAWETNRAAVYLALTTTGWKVSADGNELTQGHLNPDTYNPDNFVDFTNPVSLTITAEDLSTRTITLTLVLE